MKTLRIKKTVGSIVTLNIINIELRYLLVVLELCFRGEFTVKGAVYLTASYYEVKNEDKLVMTEFY